MVKRKAWRSLLIGYLFASYISIIPGYFIEWGTPADSKLTIIDILWQTISAPIIAPIRLYCETRLAFLWGLDVLPEGLIPLAVFIVVFGLSTLISYKYLFNKLDQSKLKIGN
ncbi:MAG: hypothetical protein ACYSO4_05105 [Planctomycetota bacterium]|jgi:hypothetical protein